MKARLKQFSLLLLLVGLFSLLMPLLKLNRFGYLETSVRAEDDEEDDRYEDDDEEEHVTRTSTSQNNPRTTTKTTYVNVTTTEYITKTVTIVDSDKDGLLDPDDPHPLIPEILIVKDDNMNGIVDELEINEQNI